jgi:rRNA maturation endonuclease Nob1
MNPGPPCARQPDGEIAMTKDWPRVVCHGCNAVLATKPDIDNCRWHPCPDCGGRDQGYGFKIGEMETCANKTVPEGADEP